MERRQLKAWAFGLGFYTAVAGLFAVQKLIVYSGRGERLGVNGFFITLLGIYTWAALTPVIMRVARRYPLDGSHRWRNLVAHGLTLAVVIPVDMGIYAALDALFRGLTWGPTPPPLSVRFAKLFLWGAPGDVLWYGGVVAVSHAMGYHERFRREEIRGASLLARLLRARLQVLRTQLQPHFLFNTLHAVSALVHEDPASARRMLARLAHLLWLTLRNDGKQEVSLREELEMLECYLEIQQVRFAERLEIRREIQPAALAGRVPNLILQPLVENAVRHGIARSSRIGLIEVRAVVDGDRLRLEVRDNGAGLPEGRLPSEGVGLSNTRARLEQLYGNRQRFELKKADGAGMLALVELPFVEGGRREPLPIEWPPTPELASPSVGPPVPAGDRSPTPPAATGSTAGFAWLAGGWVRWAAILGAWLLFGILLAGQSLLLAVPEGGSVSAQRFYYLAYQSVLWSCWTAIILRVCARFPLGSGSWRENLAAHAAANAVLFAAGVGLSASLDHVIGFVSWMSPTPHTLVERLVRMAPAVVPDYVLRYWLVVGMGHAISYARMARERELATSRLEARVAETELHLLTLQLQPRFLFETLRTIAGRVDEDPRGAVRLLTRLGDLLRLVLDRGEAHEVPLEEELTALEPYLKIQQARFRELSVRRDIPTDAALAGVPNLVLQTLVDAALRHGAARRAGATRLEIRARRENGALQLVVEEGGESLPREEVESPESAAGETVENADGLENTRTRLRQLYGAEHRFELAAGVRGGLRIDLEIPYRRAFSSDYTDAKSLRTMGQQ